MRTTTVIWKYDIDTDTPEGSSLNPRKEKLFELLGDQYNEFAVHTSHEHNNETHIVCRTWPNLATANAWIEFVNQYGPVSAQVDPE